MGIGNQVDIHDLVEFPSLKQESTQNVQSEPFPALSPRGDSPTDHFDERKLSPELLPNQKKKKTSWSQMLNNKSVSPESQVRQPMPKATSPQTKVQTSRRKNSGSPKGRNGKRGRGRKKRKVRGAPVDNHDYF